MALGKGIPVINGFDLNSKLPLDSRTVADTMENMNKLVTDASVGDGQLCYCKADKKLYVLKDNVWSEVGGGGGEGLNILSLNLKDHMNESDYNELVGYILQKTVIAKAYNITLPDLTGVDVVKFAIETPIGNTNAIFYRNSKALTQFNWLCNWADNENFMQMVTITGNTDNNVNYIKYNGINSGGSKSVPPTLNLVDLETSKVRTTITEEEYNNLVNGLYNQVIYATESNSIFAFSPSKLFNMGGEYVFVQFRISANADETFSYSSMIANLIIIGEKNASNEYPITVTEAFTIDTTNAQIVDCTLTDQTDITKGGTVDNVPNAPFLLRIPLKLEDEGSYGKHLLDNILVPMNYTIGKFEQGIQKVVPDKYFGAGFALSTYYYASVDISTKKVSITSQTNASYVTLPVDLPTESQPTVTISNPKQDILLQTMLVGNDFYTNGVVLYGYLFTWTSPVYTKDVIVDNTTYYTMFYYTAGYDDVNDNLIIRYHEIPITTTITFEN